MRNQSLSSIRHWWLPALLLCGSLAAGCRSTPTVAAIDLPATYRAPDVAQRPPIDLSVLAQETVDSDLLYPGDVVKVSIASGGEERAVEPETYRLAPSGEVDLKVVGPVSLAGISLADAEAEITRLAVERRLLRSPTVTVQLEERQTDRVRVVGAVNEPGFVDLPRAGSDLLAALVKAKGLHEDAGTVIEIRHPQEGVVPASFESAQPPSVTVDLVDAMSGKIGDVSLRDGSVVMVHPHVPDKVYVHGLVLKDGEYELPKDRPLRASQAVALAGGRENELADEIHIMRFVPDRAEPIVIEVSLREAKANRLANPILMNGDVVSVEETPTTFLADFFRNFFRIGFSSAIPGF